MPKRWMKLMVFLLVGAKMQPAEAQDVPRPIPSGCTYQTCALRIEPVFLGVALMKGSDGEQVARLGGFGSGMDVLLTGPDSAATLARSYISATRRATVLGLLGAVAYGVVMARTDHFHGHADATDAAVIVGGAGFLIASVPFTLKAQRSLSRAIWWYNAALPK